MHVVLALEKSQYSWWLCKVINYNLSEQERQQAYDAMQVIENKVKEMGDELQILITSKNTPRPLTSAPPMKIDEKP